MKACYYSHQKNNIGLHATTQNNSKVSKHKAKPNCRTSNTQFTVDKKMIWHTHRIVLRKVHRLTEVLCVQGE